METESVLVTGGAGYIGSHAVLALLDRGHSVVVLDNLSTGSREAVPPGVRLYEGCASDADLISRIVEAHSVTAALHFAGSIIVHESVINPVKYYRNNTSESLAFISAILEAGVTKFVFSSTAAVYGICDSDVVTEDAVLNPISPYGWSKMFTEQMIRDIFKANPQASATILRYFNVAGADPQGRTGQRNENATHLIRMAIDVATGAREHLTIFGDDYPTKDGTAERDFIHVTDLANAHVLALEGMVKRRGVQTFNCGYGAGASVLDVVDALEQVSGRSIPTIMSGRRPGDAARVIADPSRIVRELGWVPAYPDLKQIIASALDWQNKLSSAR